MVLAGIVIVGAAVIVLMLVVHVLLWFVMMHAIAWICIVVDVDVGDRQRKIGVFGRIIRESECIVTWR